MTICAPLLIRLPASMVTLIMPENLRAVLL